MSKDNERVIKFEKGKLYGPKLTKDIKKDDYFIDCYRKAARQTLEIISNENTEFFKIKNIIAFLGNRGQGKTSVMQSYTYALSHKNKVLFKNELEYFNFINLDIVDPSTFEDCSNVLDIVLGQLLDRVQRVYEENYRNNSKEDITFIIEKFSNLYNQVRIIKNKELLNKNFEIYDGSIESLLTISDVSKFKQNLSELIQDCLHILGEKNKRNILVISIDDIDIDLSHCYETIDTVRKYLNISNVLIIMAAKLEQLHEGIRMEHLSKLQSHTIVDSNRIYEDIYNMATKYLLKILPQNRRIHIPDLINNIGVLGYNIKIKTEKDLNLIQPLFANLLYEKTGILVLNNSQVHSYLLNGNLRNMIDLYSCLYDMEKPKKGFNEDASLYLKNLEKFKDYFLNNWCTNNLSYTSARLIRKLYNNGSLYKNHSLIQLLIELEDQDEEAKKMLGEKLRTRGKRELFYDLSDISYLLNKVENHAHAINVDDVSKFVYSIKMCYTIIMNQLRFTDNLSYSPSSISNKYENYSTGHLLKFVGGRILIEEIQLKINNRKVGLEECVNSKILSRAKEMLCSIKSFEDYKYTILGLILSTTSKNKSKDIYFYNYRNTSDPFYFDPFLFFVNCLDIQFSSLYFFNPKYPRYKMDLQSKFKYNDKLVEIYEFRKDLEFVARSIICNFNLYDFLIDYLDLNFKISDPKGFKLDEIYEAFISWLSRLRYDLEKQYSPANLINDLLTSIDQTIEILKEIKKIYNCVIPINEDSENKGKKQIDERNEI